MHSFKWPDKLTSPQKTYICNTTWRADFRFKGANQVLICFIVLKLCITQLTWLLTCKIYAPLISKSRNNPIQVNNNFLSYERFIWCNFSMICSSQTNQNLIFRRSMMFTRLRYRNQLATCTWGIKYQGNNNCNWELQLGLILGIFVGISN